MKFSRLLSAAALTAGLTAHAQPPAGGTPPAATNPAPTTPDTKADVEKAIEAIKSNKPDECKKHLEEAYKKDPKMLLPLCQMAVWAAQSNNGQAARQLLEQASIENPNHPDPYILTGDIALQEGRLMDATLAFEHALVKLGSSDWSADQRPRWELSARRGLARAYANRREGVKALAQLQQLLNNDRKNASIRKEAALLAFVLYGNADNAFAELKTAHADDPNNPQIGLPESNMAAFYGQKPVKDANDPDIAKNKASAEEWHKKALDAFKNDVKAPREYGRWLLNEGRLEEADKQLAAAKAIKADDNETNALMGLSLRYKKKFAEAEKTFDDLNRAERTNPFYAWNYALCMAESGDKAKQDQAVAVAQLAQAAQPKNPEAFSVLGWCLFKANRVDDAEKALAASLQASGGQASPDTIYFYSAVQNAKGKGKDVREALKKSLEAKAPFVYRTDAQALLDQLVKTHGAVEEKKDEPKKP